MQYGERDPFRRGNGGDSTAVLPQPPPVHTCGPLRGRTASAPRHLVHVLSAYRVQSDGGWQGRSEHYPAQG